MVVEVVEVVVIVVVFELRWVWASVAVGSSIFLFLLGLVSVFLWPGLVLPALFPTISPLDIAGYFGWPRAGERIYRLWSPVRGKGGQS